MKKLEVWKFGVQVFFSAVVIALCVGKLATDENNRDLALYWGGLSGILAYWLPSPANGKDEEQFRVNREHTAVQIPTENGLVQRFEKTEGTIDLTKTQN